MPTSAEVSPRMRQDAADIFRLRCRLGLSQAAFADRFGLSVGSVQNVEQARFAATRIMRLVLAAIALDADLMARAGAAAKGSRRSKAVNTGQSGERRT